MDTEMRQHSAGVWPTSRQFSQRTERVRSQRRITQSDYDKRARELKGSQRESRYTWFVYDSVETSRGRKPERISRHFLPFNSLICVTSSGNG